MNSIRSNLCGLFLVAFFMAEAAFSQSNDTITIHHKYYSTAFSMSKHFPVVVKYWLTKAMLNYEQRFKRQKRLK
jgi:hypothetical protein